MRLLAPVIYSEKLEVATSEAWLCSFTGKVKASFPLYVKIGSRSAIFLVAKVLLHATVHRFVLFRFSIKTSYTSMPGILVSESWHLREAYNTIQLSSGYSSDVASTNSNFVLKSSVPASRLSRIVFCISFTEL